MSKKLDTLHLLLDHYNNVFQVQSTYTYCKHGERYAKDKIKNLPSKLPPLKIKHIKLHKFIGGSNKTLGVWDNIIPIYGPGGCDLTKDDDDIKLPEEPVSSDGSIMSGGSEVKEPKSILFKVFTSITSTYNILNDILKENQHYKFMYGFILTQIYLSIVSIKKVIKSNDGKFSTTTKLIICPKLQTYFTPNFVSSICNEFNIFFTSINMGTLIKINSLIEKLFISISIFIEKFCNETPSEEKKKSFKKQMSLSKKKVSSTIKKLY